MIPITSSRTPEGKKIADMLLSGEIDTAIRAEPLHVPDVMPLFQHAQPPKTGKITWELYVYTLRRVHDLVHAGDIDLDAHAIASAGIDGTKKVALWGTYIAALLKHLGCDRIK